MILQKHPAIFSLGIGLEADTLSIGRGIGNHALTQLDAIYCGRQV
jgi:hypothetical protein